MQANEQFLSETVAILTAVRDRLARRKSTENRVEIAEISSVIRRCQDALRTTRQEALRGAQKPNYWTHRVQEARDKKVQLLIQARHWREQKSSKEVQS